MKANDIMSFDIPVERTSEIKVIGIGGGGSNAVNHMCRQGIKGVDFIVVNTDKQALEASPVSTKIQIGESLTEGRGAGSRPEIGRQAAIENLDDVMKVLDGNTKMVFLTAGMGGGTGTGAAPVIAQACREAGLLTVAIVTLPFRFEGQLRLKPAIEGLEEIAKHVDSLIAINNEKLREIHGNLRLSEAFSEADDVLLQAAKGIAELITITGYINVDFNDVQTVMQTSGVALMGSAVAEGENRALTAIEQSLNSPLLNNNDITGANKILLNITSGEDEVSMDEVAEITDFVDHLKSKDALVIWGVGSDPELGNKVCVTIVATGFDADIIPELQGRKEPVKERILLDNDKPAFRKTIEDTEMESGDKESVENKTEEKDEFEFKIIQKNIPFEAEAKDDWTVKQEGNVQSRKSKRKKPKDQEGERKFIPAHKADIDEIESVPAYMRYNVPIDDENYNEQEPKVSRSRLFGDDDVQISNDNSYLHDNVD
jgi:cell division protein FtsZ